MRDSIIQRKDFQDTDLFDCRKREVARHHVFEGKNRQLSDDDGLWVSLTPDNHNEGHRPSAGIVCDAHSCKKMAMMLHMLGQISWELNWIVENIDDGEDVKEKAQEMFQKRYGKLWI